MRGSAASTNAIAKMFTEINPSDYPDSPYADELQREHADLRFDAPLEAEYTPIHLRRSRLRVRVWFVMVLITRVLVMCAEARSSGLASPHFLVQLLVLIPSTSVLVWLSWSAHFEGWYLRIAPYLLPPFYAVIAAAVVHAITRGSFEQFAALSVAQVAVYLLAGLKFREALITNLCLMASFQLAADAMHMQPAILLKCTVVMLVTGVLVTVAARDIERTNRRQFLEHALMSGMLMKDSLSGLLNRRAFDHQLDRLWSRAPRMRSTIAICMIDVDHFKRYNDAFGHQAGDSALSRIGPMIRQFARGPFDLAARYGGEEFSLILCDMSAEELEDITEQLRRRVENERMAPHALQGEDAVALTVSIGAAVMRPGVDRTARGGLQLADEALYQAKRSGRNRAIVRRGEDYGMMHTGKFEVLRMPA
jgi:diguanylate cyclase (GGDEF)-like protein